MLATLVGSASVPSGSVTLVPSFTRTAVMEFLNSSHGTSVVMLSPVPIDVMVAPMPLSPSSGCSTSVMPPFSFTTSQAALSPHGRTQCA